MRELQLDDPTEKTRVIVAICTFQRPVMLRTCLDSIFGQDIPSQWQVEVLVVDNDANSQENAWLEQAAMRSPLKLHYVSEPQQGIPFARNAACRKALELGAEWILFLDDDEEAEPCWLSAYQSATAVAQADAFTGSVRFLSPEPGQRRQIGMTLADRADLSPLKRAATNNVMISSRILQPPRSMKFDTHMAFSGGSDLEFFTRLTVEGGRIVFVKAAVVSEVVLENRMRLGWRLHRQYRVSANKIYIKFKKYGVARAIIFSQKELLMRLFEGSFGLIALPFFFLAAKDQFENARFRTLVSFAKAGGIVAGLLGHHPQPYKQIDGH